MGYSFGQNDESEDTLDMAKLSSDEALSLIDSLKGSSLVNSVTGGIENFSLSAINQSNNNDVNDGLLNDSSSSRYGYLIGGIDQNSSEVDSLNKTIPLPILESDSLNKTIPLPILESDSLNKTIPLPILESDSLNKTIPLVKVDDTPSKSNTENMQSLLVLPYPMSIQSKDYVPLYSSMPMKISNGTILAKLPCDGNNKPVLYIVGSSADNNVFPINLNLITNMSKPGSMCMYNSIVPDNLSNLLYSHTLINIYLYNSLDIPVEVPTTTSVFIGIHKLTV
jgi:hypothetical protein